MNAAVYLAEAGRGVDNILSMEKDENVRKKASQAYNIGFTPKKNVCRKMPSRLTEKKKAMIVSRHACRRTVFILLPAVFVMILTLLSLTFMLSYHRENKHSPHCGQRITLSK
jgi:hypothetical protein